MGRYGWRLLWRIAGINQDSFKRELQRLSCHTFGNINLTLVPCDPYISVLTGQTKQLRFFQFGNEPVGSPFPNRKRYDISANDLAHAYTNDTQIMWNGVLGKMKLTARRSNCGFSSLGTSLLEVPFRAKSVVPGKLILSEKDFRYHPSFSPTSVLSKANSQFPLKSNRFWALSTIIRGSTKALSPVNPFFNFTIIS